MQSKTPSTSMNKRPREEPSIQKPVKRPVKAEDDVEPKLYKFQVLLLNGTTLELKLKELRKEMPVEEFRDIMQSKTPSTSMNKRPREEPGIQKPIKGVAKVEEDVEPKLYKFQVLLPNGTTLELKLKELRKKMPVEEFRDIVKNKYLASVRQRNSREPKRRINWNYQDLHFTDAHTRRIRLKVDLSNFVPNKSHILTLHDGSAEPDAYEDMWDLTPDTDLLKELPNDYTFETALADLIDNSLQALWSIDARERRLISVEWHRDKITIFDSGPGMDGTDGNLVKWGKMGASLHRSARAQAIGGKPPYLMPYFGMFGYGGPVATMCLGRRAVVSSKTNNCKKVFTLHLEREALMSASCSENCWRTKGGMRDPSQDEKDNSPHGSFTKVEIFDPKMKALNIKHLRCKLKDIYFPYIQCDEVSGRTSRPIEFQVNGIDLAEVQGGEVATTNLHSCNGPEFILQLHFKISQNSSSNQSQGEFLEANARLKCVYFPIIKGEESINMLIDKLKEDGCGIGESFEGFSRVSVRRLGRLLPETRWGFLPFMEPKLKVGEKAQMFKRCCSRVKCFIDTDSGFDPTLHKTDLIQHRHYTKALKTFGNRVPENEQGVQIEIFRDGKKLTLNQLEKQYSDWISEMHNRYDVEVGGGLDEPTIVFNSPDTMKLGMSSDVLRVHKRIQRRGKCWIAGQKIKVLKGACTGVHNNNVFATLEYIILEGLQGDACGEARLICRPLGLPEGRGCKLLGGHSIDIRDSKAFPIRIIDSEKCIPADESEWKNKLEAHHRKLPSNIELLSHIKCLELGIEGGFLTDIVEAGDAPPENLVAVIRPKAFNAEKCSNKLDQKFIIRDIPEMVLKAKFKALGETDGKYNHLWSSRISTTSLQGLHGFYVAPIKSKLPNLFQTAGLYKFSFSLKEFEDLQFEHTVRVKASAKVGKWKVLNNQQNALRVGSCFEPLSVVCYDSYDNIVLFESAPKLSIKLTSGSTVLSQVHNMRVNVASDKSSMTIKGIVIKTKRLDDARPNYEATLDISSTDKAFSVAVPCQVLPGSPKRITVHPPEVRKQLIPGQIIEELILEVFDGYDNHAKAGESILMSVDGFYFQDGSGVISKRGADYIKKVDAKGCIHLSNILKVSKGYGQDVSLSVFCQSKLISRLDFQTETRELRAVQKVFEKCEPGSQLENIVFEVINSEGNVDESIHDEEKHGQSHTLSIKSSSFDIDDSVRYSFRHGCCTIRSIRLPHSEGTFTFSAAHSRYPELNSDIEVHVEKPWQENEDDIGNDLDDLLSPQSICENPVILTNSPFLNSKKVVQKNFSPQSSDGYVLPINWSPPSLRTLTMERFGARKENLDIVPIQVLDSQDIGNLVGSPFICQKELEDDLANLGLERFEYLKKLEMLKAGKLYIQQSISELQASINRDHPNVLSPRVKELTIKQIESKTGSAAAVICKMHEEFPIESRPQDILGVVALLGTVESIELSRMLAQYLGEDQMCAIVCKNYEAACYLETSAFNESAAKLGQFLTGGYHAFCLEDIRPRITDPSSNPEELLPLQKPILPDGNVPKGFLGYAVNLIGIEASYLQWRTKSGHGLREALFHHLFGELQVYQDRECMMMARSCIRDGAVSLDGGIISRNGLVAFGRWEPDTLFPASNIAATPESLQTTLELLKRNKVALMETNRQIDKESKSYDEVDKKLKISLDRYNSYVSQNGTSSATR